MRSTLVFALGIIMLALGAYVALRPIWAPHHPITGSVWLDATFAVLFLVRGYMNVRSARRRRRNEPDASA